MILPLITKLGEQRYRNANLFQGGHSAVVFVEVVTGDDVPPGTPTRRLTNVVVMI